MSYMVPSTRSPTGRRHHTRHGAPQVGQGCTYVLWRQQQQREDSTTGLGLPPWSDNPQQGPTQHPTGHHSTPPQTLWHAYQLAEQWCWDRWRQLEGGPPPPRRLTDPDPGGGMWKPDKMPHTAALRLHAGLPKAHTSILTQIRTGKIGLAALLHRCRVPGFDSPACPCGWQWETAKHVILQCRRFTRERLVLRQLTATTDFQRLTSDHRAAAALAPWFLRLDLLSQFSWARDHLPPA